MRRPRILAGLVLSLLLLGSVWEVSLVWAGSGTGGKGTEVWRPLIKRLIADGARPEATRSLFARLGKAYDPVPMQVKIKELHRVVLSPERVKPIQEGLVRLGFSPGRVDGRYGPRTARAIVAFQKKNGFKPRGLPYE